jgi:class 3 adenylate cyclase/tetratricopeptide (TPR) repeat protein
MSELVDTLASYVPAIIIQQLAAQPTPLTTPRADQFPAAVLFADIKGFTPLTERLGQRGVAGTEEFSRILNEYFGALIALITEHGGDINKFAGDAILTIWPAVEGDLGTAIQRAAQCALAIQSRLHNFTAVEGVELTIRIGLGAGQVSLIQIGGVFARWEALLVGQPIVQASRAEDSASPGQVVVAPEAWALAQDALKVELFTTAEDRQGLRLQSVRRPLGLEATRFPKLDDSAEAALRAYIPGAILKRLSAGQTEYLAELRRVTVLFVNLPGFEQVTSLERAHQVMRTIQSALYKYEGSVNQFLMDDKGTTLVAAFGLPPFAHADDAARGTLAALEIQSALSDLGLRYAIGVTSGQVYCGERGSARRREYAMLGDTVNLSARLMQAAWKNSAGTGETDTADFAILCDEPTYHDAQSRVSFTILPAIQVKGKTTPIAVYRPVREKKAAARSQTDMIGRATERATLTEGLQSLQRGTMPGVILIEGEAGIGKSRLVDDLRWQARAMNLNVISGAGDVVERASYYAWQNIFSELLGVTDIRDAEARHQQIEATLEADQRERAPLLGAVWGLDWDNDLTAQITGQVRADNTRELLLDVLQRAARTPLVLVLEDAHWLDSASWALALDVSRRARELPILLVIAARPMADPLPQEYVSISEIPHFTFVRLQPLSMEDATALVCQRLGVTSLPEALSAFIREKAEGNPFFSEELAYALRDSGVIEISGSECQIAANVDLKLTAFPDTVQGILANRIDRLTPQQQLTLKVASVIGRVFAVHVLRDIHPVEADKPRLPDYLNTLERLDFTPRSMPYSDERYFFKHVITREVAYNLMLFAQRRALHRAIAEWHERTHSDDLAPHYSTLAYHWRYALDDAQPDPGQVIKALDYLEKAGEQAQRGGSYREAVEFFSQVVSLENDQKKLNLVSALRLAHWERMLGEAYSGLGRNPEARQHVDQALMLLDQPESMTPLQLGAGLLLETLRQVWHRVQPNENEHIKRHIEINETTLEVIRVYSLQATLDVLINEFDTSTVYANLRVLNLAEAAGEPSPELAQVYGLMCVTAGAIPWHAQARRYGKLTRQTADSLDNLPTLALVLSTVSIYYIGIGQWALAKAGFEQATEIFERLGDRRNWALNLTALCFLAGYQGDFAHWEEMASKIYQVAHANEHVEHQAWGLSGQAMTLMRRGQLEQAAKAMNAAMPLFASLPASDLGGIFVQGTLALLCLRQGLLDRARQVADTTSRLLSKTSIPYFTLFDSYAAVADVYLTLWEGELLQASANSEMRFLARQACKSLYRFARTYPIGQPHAWLCRGLYEWLNGRPARAQRAWLRSIAQAEQLAMPYEEGLAHYELGRHVTGDERQIHLTRAIEIFERLDTQYDLRQARAAIEIF